ncbi:uncharacterized protein DSM5745_04512 [Aspergillus mulundensis]|uniref:Uncharacterized protein n=1 Tax=Aspergillus mulundensis TaxID=1810919 RepID=A0A3D8SCW8_9EURO|nr:hypothetical protein DSM5745_04512 [Aspergillus mulundensis]RDW84186.1 hypothetical protein DSM5745_04512 [Aspergillus mulundensis]
MFDMVTVTQKRIPHAHPETDQQRPFPDVQFQTLSPARPETYLNHMTIQEGDISFLPWDKKANVVQDLQQPLEALPWNPRPVASFSISLPTVDAIETIERDNLPLGLDSVKGRQALQNMKGAASLTLNFSVEAACEDLFDFAALGFEAVGGANREPVRILPIPPDCYGVRVHLEGVMSAVDNECLELTANLLREGEKDTGNMGAPAILIVIVESYVGRLLICRFNIASESSPLARKADSLMRLRNLEALRELGHISSKADWIATKWYGTAYKLSLSWLSGVQAG